MRGEGLKPSPTAGWQQAQGNGGEVEKRAPPIAVANPLE